MLTLNWKYFIFLTYLWIMRKQVLYLHEMGCSRQLFNYFWVSGEKILVGKTYTPFNSNTIRKLDNRLCDLDYINVIDLLLNSCQGLLCGCEEEGTQTQDSWWGLREFIAMAGWTHEQNREEDWLTGLNWTERQTCSVDSSDNINNKTVSE